MFVVKRIFSIKAENIQDKAGMPFGVFSTHREALAAIRADLSKVIKQHNQCFPRGNVDVVVEPDCIVFSGTLKNICWRITEEEIAIDKTAINSVINGDETEKRKEVTIDTPFGTLVACACGDTNFPGISIDLRRDGVLYPLALVECPIEPDIDLSDKPAIISRIWGDASNEDYTTRVVHTGFEKRVSPAKEEPAAPVAEEKPYTVQLVVARSVVGNDEPILCTSRVAADTLESAQKEACSLLNSIPPFCGFAEIRNDGRIIRRIDKIGEHEYNVKSFPLGVAKIASEEEAKSSKWR